jgi:hypothetical protein
MKKIIFTLIALIGLSSCASFEQLHQVRQVESGMENSRYYNQRMIDLRKSIDEHFKELENQVEKYKKSK